MRGPTTPASSSDSAREVGRVIIRSRDALSDPRIYADEDTEKQIAEWLDCLDPSLPADRIQDVYVRVMRTRASDFPLAVTEINEGWRLLRGEETRPPRPPCSGCEFEAEGGRPCRFHPGRALHSE